MYCNALRLQVSALMAHQSGQGPAGIYRYAIIVDVVVYPRPGAAGGTPAAQCRRIRGRMGRGVAARPDPMAYQWPSSSRPRAGAELSVDAARRRQPHTIEAGGRRRRGSGAGSIMHQCTYRRIPGRGAAQDRGRWGVALDRRSARDRVVIEHAPCQMGTLLAPL